MHETDLKSVTQKRLQDAQAMQQESVQTLTQQRKERQARIRQGLDGDVDTLRTPFTREAAKAEYLERRTRNTNRSKRRSRRARNLRRGVIIVDSSVGIEDFRSSYMQWPIC
mmetsp:Transcript_29643/g.58643  ORF Transcript_29643/g.58643 Transcript_29643/m.58643 type:complete len:111 (-) Transcript_29643:12-344(-)